jgi:putative FmdB family regulatory protein
MPTYEYRCPEGHDFERFFRTISAAEPSVACPECGKMAERRMSAGAGLLFKGSGFYLTDYGKNAHRSSGSAPKSDSGSASGGGGGGGDGGSAAKSESSSASSESKPAAKTESKPASPAPKSDK